MSAPTSLDGGALQRELARRVPRQRTGASDRRATGRGPDRRRSDALAVLARTHDQLCTQAVDPSEIAAGLESAGISDRQARSDFGVASVFELAALLHDGVPRRPQDVAPPADPWRRPWARSLLRGALYATPGVLYALALGLLPAGAGLWLLVGATVAATALGQGVSLLAHVLLGRGDDAAAGAVLRAALGGGLALLALAVALAAATAAVPVPSAALAAGQLLYLLAATALVVTGADLLLLGVLTPGVLLAALPLSGAVDLPRAALLAVLAATLAAVLVAAWVRCPQPAAPGVVRTALLPDDARLAALHLSYGAVTAGLLAFPVVDLLTGRAPGQAHAVALVMAPLVASLGVADWLVHHLRSAGWTALQQCTSPAQFRRRTERLLLRGVGAYAALLAVLTAVVLVAAGAERPLVLDAAACGVLGTALLLGALLLSLGRSGTALAAGAAALALDAALRPLLDQRAGEGWPAQHLLVFTALLLALLPLVRHEYGQVTRHR